MPRYAVVGAGFSGVAATHYLQEAGHEVVLFERDGDVGGRSQSARLGDVRVTFGGKNIGRHYTHFRAFTAAMGDNPYEFFGINSSRVEDGEIKTLDSTRKRRSVMTFARRAPKRDVLRFAALAALVRANERNRFLGSPAFARLSARYDSRPLSSYFSPLVCERLLRTLSVRMNGAEPDEVWPGNFGSNMGTLLDTYDQLTLGLGRVFEQFRARTDVRTESPVRALLREGGRVTGVEIGDGPHAGEHEFDGVVLAMPAAAAGALLRPGDEALADLLRRPRYYPGAVVIARYDRPIFSEEVRALVFDASEPVSNAGAYGVDQRHIVRYTFSGRAAREELRQAASPEELLARAESNLDRWFPVARAERLDFVSRRWDDAYCAYSPHHHRFLAELRARLARHSGLQLAGDYLRGVSIEACFRSARDAVDATLAAGSSSAGRARPSSPTRRAVAVSSRS